MNSCRIWLTLFGYRGSLLGTLFPISLMSPERTPSSAENRPETQESQRESSSLLQRMKSIATSTRGRLAAAVLALGGVVEGANKADAATMVPAMVDIGTNVTETYDDTATFVLDPFSIRTSNAEDFNLDNIDFVTFSRNNDDFSFDLAVDLQGVVPAVPLTPNDIDDDGIIDDDLIYINDIPTFSDSRVAVAGHSPTQQTTGLSETLEGTTVRVGIGGEFTGNPLTATSPEELMAMYNGRVMEALMPNNIGLNDVLVLYSLPQATNPTADFNGSGVVDAADYTVWRDNFGNTNATNALGDADGDNDVDGADFLAWQTQFGSSSAASQANTNSIPEPSTLALGLSAAAAAAAARRKRKQEHGQ